MATNYDRIPPTHELLEELCQLTLELPCMCDSCSLREFCDEREDTQTWAEWLQEECDER